MIKRYYLALATVVALITQPTVASYSPPRPLWSILICTLDERKAQFEQLRATLQKQIDDAELTGFIEICSISDSRQMPTGTKRNLLLEQSKGKYICFIDDDDEVHPRYVEMIFEKLLKNPDCVSLVGIVTVDGLHPKLFMHSIKYSDYYDGDPIFLRPPNHLNPIRRSIAIKFPFPNFYIGEDFTWAREISKSGLLRKEETIKVPYYFYRYRSKKR